MVGIGIQGSGKIGAVMVKSGNWTRRALVVLR